ncbi:MAG: tunicamycin resistance protein [Chrysothrix sp. TS-e1954]|nr:MAG: tunicamycin resistance protein [Chrysothrix sp. TS-e1954]
MTTSLSRNETWALLAISVACCGILAQSLYTDGTPLVASVALSGLSFVFSYAWIRWLGDAFIKRGLCGKDMSKKGRPQIPEAMGALCAVVYLGSLIFFIPFLFYKDIAGAMSSTDGREVVSGAGFVEKGRFLDNFPHAKFEAYESVLISHAILIILGIGDDLMDIRWRHKIFIPAIASVPLLMVYWGTYGVTTIVIPTMLQKYFGELLDLGWLYYAYLGSLTIFCPNSINILAGVNGIEASQSILIALFILFNDLLYLYPSSLYPFITPSTIGTTRFSFEQPHPAAPNHLNSLYLLLPFLGVSFALLSQNWYPAKVFVGDTYCYFAGMVFVVVAIQGHFSKTLLLLLVPQIFNFIYSAPQLFGLIPCPRHRLPHFNARSGLLEPSWADFGAPIKPSASTPSTANGHADGLDTSAPNGVRPSAKPKVPHLLVQKGLKALAALRLVRIDTDRSTGKVLRCTNLTILNLFLVWLGPIREDTLTMVILGAQAICGAAGLWVRHRLAGLVFSMDNL